MCTGKIATTGAVALAGAALAGLRAGLGYFDRATTLSGHEQACCAFT